MATIQSNVYIPDVPEYRIDPDAPTPWRLAFVQAEDLLRVALADLLCAVSYTADSVRVLDPANAADALRRLDALTGGGR